MSNSRPDQDVDFEREFVVVQKRRAEIDALADEMAKEQMAKFIGRELGQDESNNESNVQTTHGKRLSQLPNQSESYGMPAEDVMKPRFESAFGRRREKRFHGKQDRRLPTESDANRQRRTVQRLPDAWVGGKANAK